MRLLYFYWVTLLLLMPIFFINYRVLAFHTLPYDSYHEYVLALDGLLDWSVIDAPGGYRVAFYGTAFLVYKVFPLIPLSQLQIAHQESELRAIQALAMTSFFFLHAYFFTAFYFIRYRLGRSFITASGIAALAVLISFYAYPHGTDPLYFFYSLLCLYFIRLFKYLFPLLLLSPLVNEKISLAFGMYFLGMVISSVDQRKALFGFGYSVLVFGLYLLIRTIVALPTGLYGYQTDITQFWSRLALSWPFLVSVKGFYTNWLPLLLLTGIGGIAWKYKVFDTKDVFLHPVIVAMPLLFFILGAFACSDYGIGRAAMHALPFFIAPIVVMLERFD